MSETSRLLTDDEIKALLKPFWNKYYGISAAEVRELHFNELYNIFFAAGEKTERERNKETVKQLCKEDKDLGSLKMSFYKAGVIDGQFTNHKHHGQQFRDYEQKIAELEAQKEKDRQEINRLTVNLEKYINGAKANPQALSEAENRGAKEVYL